MAGNGCFPTPLKNRSWLSRDLQGLLKRENGVHKLGGCGTHGWGIERGWGLAMKVNQLFYPFSSFFLIWLLHESVTGDRPFQLKSYFFFLFEAWRI